MRRSGSWRRREMVVEEEGGERSSGADIISAVRGSRRSRPIGSGSVKSSGGDATQCQSASASPDQGVCRAGEAWR